MTSLASSTSYRTLYDHAKATVLRPQPAPQVKASIYQIRRVTESLKALEVQTFLEFERIKKPSAAVLAIARMTCVFFEAIRNQGPEQMDQVESMQSWQQIQEYMRTQLTSCIAELRSQLKQKIVQLGRMHEIESLTQAGQQTERAP